MKKSFFVLLIAAALCAPACPAQAFDPGSWARQGLLALDSHGAEYMARARDQKNLSGHARGGDTVRRIKNYLKADSGKSRMRSR